MKKQGFNSRLNESLGERNGKKSQSMKSRRDESESMSKRKFGGNKSMAYHSNNIKAHKKM